MASCCVSPPRHGYIRTATPRAGPPRSVMEHGRAARRWNRPGDRGHRRTRGRLPAPPPPLACNARARDRAGGVRGGWADAAVASTPPPRPLHTLDRPPADGTPRRRWLPRTADAGARNTPRDGGGGGWRHPCRSVAWPPPVPPDRPPSMEPAGSDGPPHRAMDAGERNVPRGMPGGGGTVRGAECCH